MTPTVKFVLLLLGSFGALACLVVLVALCRAASRPTPEMSLAEQWQGKTRKRSRQPGSQADQLHPLER